MPFISHERYDRWNKARAFLDIAPELVVEILSPENAHIDMAQKVQEYLDVGVALVLVVDPDTRTVMAHRAGSVGRHAMGDEVPCGEALPGFVLPVAAVSTRSTTRWPR